MPNRQFRPLLAEKFSKKFEDWCGSFFSGYLKQTLLTKEIEGFSPVDLAWNTP